MHDQADPTVVSADVPSGDVPSGRSPLRLALLVTVIAATTVATTLGTAFSPRLVGEAPLVLIALNPNWRHLILAVPVTDVAPFLVVTMSRTFAADPFFYFLGRWYGNDAIVWVERHAGRTGRVLRWVERKFKNWGRVILFFAPGGFICMLAGASGMSRSVFFLIDIAATLTGALVWRFTGDVLSSPIETVRGFISEHVGVLMVCTVALVTVGWLFRLRFVRRRAGD